MDFILAGTPSEKIKPKPASIGDRCPGKLAGSYRRDLDLVRSQVKMIVAFRLWQEGKSLDELPHVSVRTNLQRRERGNNMRLPLHRGCSEMNVETPICVEPKFYKQIGVQNSPMPGSISMTSMIFVSRTQRFALCLRQGVTATFLGIGGFFGLHTKRVRPLPGAHRVSETVASSACTQTDPNGA